MPVRVVAAVIRRGSQVLAAQRAACRREALLWEFPGGKVEPGETDEAAISREIQEELAIGVRALRILATASHAYAHSEILLVAWACEWIGGEPEPREHAALRWMDADGLSGLQWAPADLPLLPSVDRWLRTGSLPPARQTTPGSPPDVA